MFPEFQWNVDNDIIQLNANNTPKTASNCAPSNHTQYLFYRRNSFFAFAFANRSWDNSQSQTIATNYLHPYFRLPCKQLPTRDWCILKANHSVKCSSWNLLLIQFNWNHSSFLNIPTNNWNSIDLIRKLVDWECFCDGSQVVFVVRKGGNNRQRNYVRLVEQRTNLWTISKVWTFEHLPPFSTIIHS